MLDHCALCEFPCQIPTSAYLIFLMWHILSCSRRIYNFDTNASINDISFKQLRSTVLSLSEEDALKIRCPSSTSLEKYEYSRRMFGKHRTFIIPIDATTSLVSMRVAMKGKNILVNICLTIIEIELDATISKSRHLNLNGFYH